MWNSADREPHCNPWQRFWPALWALHTEPMGRAMWIDQSHAGGLSLVSAIAQLDAGSGASPGARTSS